MKMLILSVFLFLLPCVLFAQIRITKNEEIVTPNSTGINIESSDIITVTIQNGENDACMKNMNLQVALTDAEKSVRPGKRQEQQSQQQLQSANKPKKHVQNSCSMHGYKSLNFRLINKNTWVCSFKVSKYWKEKEIRSYIFLCYGNSCNVESSTLNSELVKYFFYLMP